MKTPEEIKKGLEACVAGECHSKRHECPYRKEAECTMALSEDALAYIYQLEAQLPRWSSVEERPPESEHLVLIHYKSRFTSIGYWCEDFAEWDGMTDEQIARPDFWMPLPEAPKEG